MKHKGFSQADIDAILIYNPAAALAGRKEDSRMSNSSSSLSILR